MPAAERILAAGALVLSLGCAINALTGDFVTRGMANIGIGLIFPSIAILIMKAESGDRRRTLAALSLWFGTVPVPELLPAFPVWLRLAVALLTFLSWVLIPRSIRLPRSIESVLLFNTRLPLDLAGALFAAALLAAVNGTMPPWIMPVVLAAGCLSTAVFLERRARVAHFYFAGLVFAAAPLALPSSYVSEFFAPLSLAGAVLLAVVSA